MVPQIRTSAFGLELHSGGASRLRRDCRAAFSGQLYATRASMQSGSLYLGEFIFGDMGETFEPHRGPDRPWDLRRQSHGSKPSTASITGMRVCKSLIPSQASVVRMVQESMPSFQRSQSPAKVKGRPQVSPFLGPPGRAIHKIPRPGSDSGATSRRHETKASWQQSRCAR